MRAACIAGIDETLLANSAGGRDADARQAQRLQSCPGLDALRIDLSGTTMAALAFVRELIGGQVGRRKAAPAKRQNKAT